MVIEFLVQFLCPEKLFLSLVFFIYFRKIWLHINAFFLVPLLKIQTISGYRVGNDGHEQTEGNDRQTMRHQDRNEERQHLIHHENDGPQYFFEDIKHISDAQLGETEENARQAGNHLTTDIPARNDYFGSR